MVSPDPGPCAYTLHGLLASLDQFHRESNDRNIVFLLGAGASFTSGIPTGAQLAIRWLQEIQAREDHQFPRPLEEWATEKFLGTGFKDFELSKAAEFYPQLFERRFACDPQGAFAHLEALMEEARPSFGYLVLAKILGSTRHRVVVTTNFDSLVADALATIGMRRPLVCGHESLAGFAQRGLQRPLVAQVHRGLFLAPINDAAGTAQLAPGWKEALGSLFERSLILVIGYGGNDGSLMDYLDVMPLRENGSALYWCHRHGDILSPRVARLLVKQRGIAVAIPGFDELMVQLAPGLLKNEWDVESMAEGIKHLGQQAAQDFRKAHDELIQKEVPKKTDKPQSLAAKADSQATLQALGKAQKTKTWWMWEMEANSASTPDARERIYHDALAALPKNADLAGNFANFLTDIRKDHDEAERFYRHALKLDPKHANNLGNFAAFLTDIRKDHDEAERLFRLALDLDPNHANNLGNFANFLTSIRKNYDEAERHYRQAFELAPKQANNLGNFAAFLTDVRKEHDKAEQHYRHALELAPNHANNLGNFASFLTSIRENHDEAEQQYRRALELDPNNANFHGNFANFLWKRREDHHAAERHYRRALELDPNHPDNLGNYASFLLSIGRVDEAAELARRAYTLSAQSPSQVTAEALMYLGLAGLLKGEDTQPALGRLKHMLAAGYPRGSWSFESLHKALAPSLSLDQQAFYQALGEAILDESRIPTLETFLAWNSLSPVDPREPWPMGGA